MLFVVWLLRIGILGMVFTIQILPFVVSDLPLHVVVNDLLFIVAVGGKLNVDVCGRNVVVGGSWHDTGK